MKKKGSLHKRFDEDSGAPVSLFLVLGFNSDEEDPVLIPKDFVIAKGHTLLTEHPEFRAHFEGATQFKLIEIPSRAGFFKVSYVPTGSSITFEDDEIVADILEEQMLPLKGTENTNFLLKKLKARLILGVEDAASLQ